MGEKSKATWVGEWGASGQCLDVDAAAWRGIAQHLRDDADLLARVTRSIDPDVFFETPPGRFDRLVRK